VSGAEGDILDLWHGDLANRRYAERRNGFHDFEFDPAADIKHNSDGVWCWNSDKPALHVYLRKQFELMEEAMPAINAEQNV
jgi:hypothetical protein